MPGRSSAIEWCHQRRWDQRIFYGGFHTFARHIDGRGRFVVDYESTDVDEAAYHADDVAAFVS